MGSTKLTERALVPLLKPNASALIAQLEGSAGSEIESLRRISVDRLIAAAFPDDSISGDVAIFSDGADNIPLKALTLRYLPTQLGSGVPSPDNVRAIHGKTGAIVYVGGANIYDSSQNVRGTFGTDGAVIESESATTEITDYIQVDDAFTVRGHIYTSQGSYPRETVMACIYDEDKVFVREYGIQYKSDGDGSFRLPLNSGEKYVRYTITARNIGNSEYQMYSQKAYQISWSDEAGTVYSGTLDVLSGILTVDRVMFTIDGDSTLSTLDTSSDGFNRVTYAPYSSIGVSNITFDCCDMFECIAPRTTAGLYKVWNSTSASSPRMFFGLPKTVDTLDAAKAWFALNETHIVAQIASPQTYQLTPANVRTLLGDNIISANTDDMDLTYCADPNLYIERKISEAVADCASVHADANTLTLATTE